jgi:hypothetical protein
MLRYICICIAREDAVHCVYEMSLTTVNVTIEGVTRQ